MRVLLVSLGILLATCAMAQERTKTPELKGWKLIWADEFDNVGLPDAKKWGYEHGFVRNKEMQFYQKARKKNSRVENGMLILEGHKEHLPLPEWANGKGADWKKKRKAIEYTSASINTQKTFSFTYGRVEVRAKVPFGGGMWPAVWTLGTNISKVGWPRCGEIDIMEYFCSDAPHRFSCQNHFANPIDKTKHMCSGGAKFNLKDPHKDFHVFAIEWDEKEIKFFVDGKQYSKLTVDVAGKGADNPFRKPHYLLLNLALGGTAGGKIDPKVLPQKYIIDYVRIYQRPQTKATK
jgi:beta-glucanase (GH16 family)